MVDILELPFDQYQRYRLAQEAIQILKAYLPVKPKILDVGGYADYHGPLLPLKLFLPDEEILVCDLIDFRHPSYLKADGTHLPFHRSSFNIVTCIDVLEHVAEEKRQAILDELLEVARDFLILIGPFYSEVSVLADKILYEFFKRQLHAEPTFLAEHLDLELPRLAKIRSSLDKQGLNYIVFPSGYVHNWLFMNLLKAYITSLPESHRLHTLVDRYYNLHFYENDQIEPSYRHAIIISKKADQASLSALKAVEELFSSYREHSRKRSLLDGDPASLFAFIDFVGLQTQKDLHISNLESIIRARDDEMQRIINDKDRHITNLESMIRTRDQELQSLREALQSSDEKISRLSKALEDKDRHIRNLESFLHHIRERLAIL